MSNSKIPNSKTHITGITDLLTFSDPMVKEQARKEEIDITNSEFKLSRKDQEDVEREFKLSIEKYNIENGIDLSINDIAEEYDSNAFDNTPSSNNISDNNISDNNIFDNDVFSVVDGGICSIQEKHTTSEDMLAELNADDYKLNNQTNYNNIQTNQANKLNDNKLDSYNNESDQINYKDTNFKKMTDNQKKQNIADSVINDIVPNMDKNNDDYESAYKLRDDDRRAEMLKDISELRDLIEKSGHQVNDLSQVDSSADIRDIERCYRSYRKYYDDVKFTNTSDDWVKIFAFGLEHLFDGKKTYFKQYSPNLTDYYKTIQTKTRFMRYDLSRAISKFSKQNNVHWIGTAVFTLIPSMIVYSRQKNKESKYDIEMEAEYNRQPQRPQHRYPQQHQLPHQRSYRNHTRDRISNRINEISQHDYMQSYNPMMN